MTNKSPQQQLLDKFGVLHQADIWVEELSELIQAIQKAKRYKVLIKEGISLTNENLTNPEHSALAIKNLYEEFADVKNVIQQFEIIADEWMFHHAKLNTKNKIYKILKS